ncbi:hypothetical protein LTR64_005043 [Lithohypha guttulata]|uniref:uncharacterized protein n=1 Tax=Lithohypha guttulata TaxID=1690604 RepID=UPI002DDFB0F5|nr:hypothetical protein LTR51_005122 [Lithohypha guttulata]
MADLLAGLTSTEDAARKMAAFKLQSMTNDPSFAEQFCSRGGLVNLRNLMLDSSGNTLAYSLASFTRLLELDHGWEAVDNVVVQKAVELVVCQPSVNILRGAMAVLVSIVSRPRTGGQISASKDYIGGFKALKPAISHYPQFLEMLVSRLSSADHALCANALQLINALMRDAIATDDEAEWPMFVKRIQDLGVIKAVYVLTQSSALQDLAHPLFEFQQLTKILLSRWRNVPVDVTKPEHRRTIKAIHLSSDPPEKGAYTADAVQKPKHDPNKWRRLGFSTESPEPDFHDMGFLGMMDLSDYVRKHQDEFQNILAEQELLVKERRCPVARASLVVTAMLFEHFEVDKPEENEPKVFLALENKANYERLFRPLLLHWSRLHVAALHAFLRIWKETGAEQDDFHKIMELIRILIESVVGGAARTRGIESVEQELATYECKRLRELQMELLDLAYDDLWGQHLRGTRDELQNEALQFMKEQRIRCILQGCWFPHTRTLANDQDVGGPVQATDLEEHVISCWRYIQLSADRKDLHWADFDERQDQAPRFSVMPNVVPLSSISSVVSNITANQEQMHLSDHERHTTTSITIHGYGPKTRRSSSNSKGHGRKESKQSNRSQQKEIVLLAFQPQNHVVASEWLDGLLMLLEQQPITAETNKIVNMVADLGLKVRLLNVRGNDDEGMLDGIDGIDAPPVPSREGLDENYFYAL